MRTPTKKTPPKPPTDARAAVQSHAPHAGRPASFARRQASPGAAPPNRPAAPPVYRPQHAAAAAQPKTSTPSRPARPTTAPLQPKTAPLQPKAAPPVYRPQPAPAVQRLAAARPCAPAGANSHAAGQGARPNLAAKGGAPPRSAAPTAQPPKAPRVLQQKASQPRTPAPPPPRPAAPAARPAPLARAHGVVQRYIAKDDPPRLVYMPETVDVTGEFQTSFRTLVGAHAVTQLSWGQFREQVWPGALTVDTARIGAWGEANLGRGLESSAHTPVPMVDSAPALDVAEVRRQFDDDSAVYHYARLNDVRYGFFNSVSHLLRPRDMREAGDPLDHIVHTPSACVIQALDDFHVNVPGVVPATHTTAAWHAYCRDHVPQIDYRTDSHYIRLYVGELHYRMVSTRVMNWNAVDWNALGGDGDYLVSSYPNGQPVGNETGHMVGVVVHGGAVQTVHDRQNLTRPHLPGGNVFVRYIFRM